MSHLDALADTLPPYAADLAANLKALAGETTLDGARKWGCFLACAYAGGEPKLLRAVHEASNLDAEERASAKAAAAIETMNSVYYRALHAMANPDYRTLPPRLQMAVLTHPGVSPETFELWAFAVAAVNGCGVCLDSHEAELRKRAIEPAQMQTALRIAAVVAAVGAVLRAETALEANASSG